MSTKANTSLTYTNADVDELLELIGGAEEVTDYALQTIQGVMQQGGGGYQSIFSSHEGLPYISGKGYGLTDEPKLSWNPVGAGSDYQGVSEPTQLGLTVVGLKGVIAHYEVAPVNNYWDTDSNKFISTCECVGAKNLYSNTPAYIANANSLIPVKRMYAWDNNAKAYDNNAPDKLFTSVNYIGKRGKSCVECIKAGENVALGNPDDAGIRHPILKTSETNGTTYPVTCALQTKAFVYVTHFIVVKGYDSQGLPIHSELALTDISQYDELLTKEDGTKQLGRFFCLSIPKSAMTGIWDGKNKVWQVRGLMTYANDILNQREIAEAYRRPNRIVSTIIIKTIANGAKKSHYLDFNMSTLDQRTIVESIKGWDVLGRHVIKPLDYTPPTNTVEVVRPTETVNLKPIQQVAESAPVVVETKVESTATETASDSAASWFES
jgi:hypothetical protein